MALSAIVLLTSAGEAAARDLSFDDRLKAQAAIERVYYSHQLDAPLPFEEAVPVSVLETKVGTYLRESAALEQVWHTPITADALARELERMRANSRMPERLDEIFAALGNDPLLIRECVARPALVSRLIRNFFSTDARIHADARSEAQILRERLVSGAIDYRSEHAHRTVVRVARDASQGSGNPQLVEPETEDPAREMRNPRPKAPAPRRGGAIGPVVEEQDSFVVKALLRQNDEQTWWGVYRIPKISWNAWWALNSDAFDPDSVTAVTKSEEFLSAPLEASSSHPKCIPGDSWQNGGLDDRPSSRRRHTAVWTGSLMIVWGGTDDLGSTNTGGRYDPATDTWSLTSTVNAPEAREYHSAVWTGREMVVWGGLVWSGTNQLVVDTGGRYDPVTDTWSRTSVVDAPAARGGHSAAWTGRQMIVWGGFDRQSILNTGARYDPVEDRWTSMSTLDAPSPRYLNAAVWTGKAFIVWGGSVSGSPTSGGRYDPDSDTWTPTSTVNAPEPRVLPVAVWTGRWMVIWSGSWGSGFNLRSGGLYDPETDTWSAMSTDKTPSNLFYYAGVWAMNKMLVWGGETGWGGLRSQGGAYDPLSNTWSSISSLNEPPSRAGHTAIWTGTQMIVWGGLGGSLTNTGGRYDPSADTWTPVSPTQAPSERTNHSAVWTGSRMLIWGGSDATGLVLDDGSQYDPALDVWTPMSRVDGPLPTQGHRAIWTGRQMLLWGGYAYSGQFRSTGPRYDPISDTWVPMSTVNAPASGLPVWTGSRMLIWNGAQKSAKYDPDADTWAPISGVNAPALTGGPVVAWAGQVMVVWGGATFSGPYLYSKEGGRYDPVTDTWAAMSTVNAPAGREWPTAVSTGEKVLVWGGSTAGFGAANTGGQYDPAADTWSAITQTNAPSLGGSYTAVWTGSEMLTWGGSNSVFQKVNTGGRYDPKLDMWAPTAVADAPAPRDHHTAVWTGSSMIVWGGEGFLYELKTGGQYFPHSVGDPPTVDAGPDRTAECTSPAGALVSLEGVGSGCGDPDRLKFTWSGPFPENGGTLEGSAADVTLPLSMNTVTLTVTDEEGRTASDSVNIEVVDSTPPALSLALGPAILWPPNHRLVDVGASLTATDACGTPSITLASVSSSEPDDGSGGADGNTSGDIQDASIGTPDTSVILRAERAGDGPGRIYALTYVARDQSGNTTSALGIVGVPHDDGTGPEPLMMSVEHDGATGMAHLYWNAVSGVEMYDLIRGNLRELTVSGGRISLGRVRVLATGQAGTSYSEGPVGENPAAGAAYFYLVQYRSGLTASGWGTESSLWPAEPLSCDTPCPGDSTSASAP